MFMIRKNDHPREIFPYQSKKFQILSALLMFYWATQLLSSNAYYVPYLFIIVAIVISYIYNRLQNNKLNFVLKETKIIMIFSFIFTCMVTLSNYDMWDSVNYTGSLRNFYIALLLFVFSVGGGISFFHLFFALSNNFRNIQWKPEVNNLSARKIFIFFFITITLINCCVLFTCYYPGILSSDSLLQMQQLLSGVYSNHHPFYHTQVIRLFVGIGLRIFGNINAAIAIYSVFQIIFMAACFSFSLSTLIYLNVPKLILLCIGAYYILMPYHITYSMTMWKDVLFGGCVLLFIISVFRCLCCLGNYIVNYILLFLSGMGFCLFRSNGFFAFVFVAFLFPVLFKRTHKKIVFCFMIIICTSFVFKYPVLEKLNVLQPDPIESLSIPAQQIARVITEGKELNETEAILLSKIVDIEKVPETYRAEKSDNIKSLVREKGQQDFLVNHKRAYLRLYFSLGMKYPDAYIRAWVDQTRGYWNSGYDYWFLASGVAENSLGIENVILSDQIAAIFKMYPAIFTNIPLLRIFLSIGFFVWLDIIMLFIAILQKNPVGIYITLPVLMIVFSLLIATPVFSEFRYIYSAFCALPIIVTLVMMKQEV